MSTLHLFVAFSCWCLCGLRHRPVQVVSCPSPTWKKKKMPEQPQATIIDPNENESSTSLLELQRGLGPAINHKPAEGCFPSPVKLTDWLFKYFPKISNWKSAAGPESVISVPLCLFKLFCAIDVKEIDPLLLLTCWAVCSQVRDNLTFSATSKRAQGETELIHLILVLLSH